MSPFLKEMFIGFIQYLKEYVIVVLFVKKT